MQFIADIIRKLIEDKKLSLVDLYNMQEKNIINIIQNSNYKLQFNLWKKDRRVEKSSEQPNNTYSIKFETKVRYINPLVNGQKIYNVCKRVKNIIDKNLTYDMSNYVYIDEINL